MFEIYLKSYGGTRCFFHEVNSEKEALDFCDKCDWHYIDENGFEWQMDYEEV